MTSLPFQPGVLVIERVLPHSREKIWRALTDGTLLEQWLMPNDFQPTAGHHFTFRTQAQAHWNGVADCDVLLVRPPEELSYRWRITSEPDGRTLRTVVTWTLTPVPGGVLLRMEQSGFQPQDEGNHSGASQAWPHFLNRLEGLLVTLS